MPCHVRVRRPRLRCRATRRTASGSGRATGGDPRSTPRRARSPTRPNAPRDGDVGRALLEVIRRVAALAHHPLHERVGFANRRARVVNEPDLHVTPFGDVPLTRRRRELADVESLAPFASLLQLAFCRLAVAGGFDGAVVFRTEAFLQTTRPPCSRSAHHDHADHDHHSDDDHDPDPRSHRCLPC
jgi:hypothetical protein